MAEGISKSDLIKGEPLDEIRRDLDAMATSLEKVDTQFKDIAKTLKSDINPILDKTSKGLRAINEQDVKSEKLIREKLINEDKLKKVKITQERLAQAELRTKVANNRETERQSKLKEKANKLTRDEIILNDKNAGTIERLMASNRKLNAERKKLNLETEKGRARLKAINKELDRNNATLEKNSDKLTKQRIGIGRYGKALNGLRTGLAKLGVAFGAAFIIKDTIDIVKNFEQSQADLASILAVNVNEMAALTEQAKELGATTTFTASQVAELQKELAKLGFTQAQIEDMTVGVLALAEATGSELSQAAAVAGSVINAFGLEAKDSGMVVDVMTKSFSSSSLDMQKFSVAMASVAPVAKTMGFSLEETTARLGVLTDSGLDASTAGTSLRNMMLEASKQGLTWNEALEKVNNSQDKAGTSLELFGKRGVAAGVILAANQEKVAELTEKLEDSAGAAEEMARVQRDTLGGALKEIRSAWEGYILGADGATGASDKLKKVIQQLARNLPAIIDGLGKIIAIITIYIARQKILNSGVIEWTRNLFKSKAALSATAKATDDASKSSKKFGKALKGIGVVLAITALIELAKAFFDVASGARQATFDAKQLDIALGKVNDSVEKDISSRQKQLDQALELAKTDEERLALQKEFRAINKIRADELAKELKIEKEKLKIITDLKKQADAPTGFLGFDSFLKVVGESADQVADLFTEFDDVDDVLGKQKAKILALEAGYKTYNDAISDTNHELEVVKANITASTEGLDDNTDSVKKNTEELEKQLKAIKDIDEVLAARNIVALEEVKTAEDEEIGQENKAIQDLLTQRLTFINDAERLETITAEQAAEQRIIAELEALNRRKEILESYGRDVIDINKDISDKRLELVKSGAEEEVKVEEDKNEEIFDAYRNLQEALTDVLTSQIDERIALLGKEADAAKSQQDFFEALAANGNITAQQSITEMIEIQREAEAEQARLAKVKQNIEMISAGVKTFTQALDSGETPAQALATTLTTTQVLASILGNLNFFEKGTDNAPEGWAIMHEKGAEIHTDSKGNIKDLGSDGGAKWQYLNKGDKVITANKSSNLLSKFDQIGMQDTVKQSQDSAGNSYDMAIINQSIQDLGRDMSKLQTQINVDWQSLAGGMAQVNVRTNKGGDKRTERYNIR